MGGGNRDMKTVESVKDRLERGLHILDRILLRRALEGSPTLGWGIERAIVDRELRELEEECLQNPPFPPVAGWVIREDFLRRSEESRRHKEMPEPPEELSEY